MVTIQNADNALKTVFLESVVNDINQKTNPFLTMVGKNKRAVTGREARANIRFNNEGSVAAGTEGGVLPINRNARTAEINTPVKNIFGTFQISDKALRSASNDSGAFASLIAQEMGNLIGTAQNSLNTMLYGNGRRLLAWADSVTATQITVPMRFNRAMAVGEVVRLFTANNVDLGAATITAVNLMGLVFTYTGAVNLTNQDRIYIFRENELEADTELNGVDSIFRQDRIYNIPAAQFTAILPHIMTSPSAAADPLGILDESALIRFFERYEEHCQGMPADILLTHPIVRKAVFENLRDKRSNIDTAELAGGFRGFSFNGIPVHSDVRCRAGTLYAINSDSWAMHELCDWTWISGEDGGILKQIDGHAGFNATLVKYADLICEKPFLQGKATNFSARRAV
ncbi:MAG: phage major capsid protein [Firmicutes bacterium]|nr:phage major capsid protein [Bacillota bacterium]